MKEWFKNSTILKLVGTGVLWAMPCGLLAWLLYFAVKDRLPLEDSSNDEEIKDQG